MEEKEGNERGRKKREDLKEGRKERGGRERGREKKEKRR